MSGQIFISYRRGDASYPAGHLYERLSAHFAHSQIFMDIDTLEPGVDFVEAIEKSVGSCDVLIAVIGTRWLMVTDEQGRRRLDHPQDFVRLEIGTALKRGIRVIPVLVEGASIPRSDQLPEDLKSLVRRHALAVSHDRFRADSERLIGAVERALEAARTEEQPKGEEQERVDTECREREEKGRQETERRETEARERLEAERRVPRQNETEVLQGIDAGSRAPSSNRAPPKEGAVKLKKPWRLQVVIGSGVAVLLLSFGLLFKAPRPHPVSVGESLGPVRLAAPSNSLSPPPSVNQPSPGPSVQHPTARSEPSQIYAEIVGPSKVVVGKRAIYRAEFEGDLRFEWHYTQPATLTDRNVFVELGYPGQTETLTLKVTGPDGRTFTTSKTITAIE